MATRSQPNSIRLSILSIDGYIRRNTNRQRHGLLSDGVVVWKLLDIVRNVIDGRLMSLTSNDSVLVWRVICKPFEKVGFLSQCINIDKAAKFFLDASLSEWDSSRDASTNRRNELITSVEDSAISVGSKGCGCDNWFPHSCHRLTTRRY